MIAQSLNLHAQRMSDHIDNLEEMMIKLKIRKLTSDDYIEFYTFLARWKNANKR
jgi:hypothetical protein